MTTRTCVWIGLFIGSSLGSLVPVLYGGDPFSISAILWNGLGGILGIWAGFKIGSAYFG